MQLSAEWAAFIILVSTNEAATAVHTVVPGGGSLKVYEVPL